MRAVAMSVVMTDCGTGIFGLLDTSEIPGNIEDGKREPKVAKGDDKVTDAHGVCVRALTSFV